MYVMTIYQRLQLGLRMQRSSVHSQLLSAIPEPCTLVVKAVFTPAVTFAEIALYEYATR